MSLPDNFANALNHSQSQNDHLNALHPSSSGKARKVNLSSSAPSILSGDKAEISPKQALKEVKAWLKDPSHANALSAKGAKNLRALCSEQVGQAQQKETGLISLFFSSAAKDGKTLEVAIDKARCKALLQKRPLDEAEKKELTELLSKNIPASFSKTDKKELLKNVDQAFVDELMRSPENKSAFKNLCQLAYNQGQIFTLFQKVVITAEAKEVIQQAVNEAMTQSIEQSKKGGLLSKLGIGLFQASTTLRIPLDEGRQAVLQLNTTSAEMLDTIISANALAAVGHQMGYEKLPDETLQAHTFFMSCIINASLGSECKIPILKSCFNNPERANQIAVQNSRQIFEFRDLATKALSLTEKQGYNDLIATLNRLPTEQPIPSEACKTGAQAITYDVLGLWHAVDTPKTREEVILTNSWNESKNVLKTLQSRFGNTSPDSPNAHLFKQAEKLLQQTPSFERYRKLTLILDKIQNPIFQPLLGAKAERATFSASAPAALSSVTKAPTGSAKHLEREQLATEITWIEMTLNQAQFETTAPERKFPSSQPYIDGTVDTMVKDLPTLSAKSNQKQITAAKASLDTLRQSLPTPWSLSQVINELQQREKIDNTLAQSLIAELEKAKEQINDLSAKLQIMENISYQLASVIAQISLNDRAALYYQISGIMPLMRLADSLAQSRPYKDSSNSELVKAAITKLEGTYTGEIPTTVGELALFIENKLIPSHLLRKGGVKNNPDLRNHLNSVDPLLREILIRVAPKFYT